MQLAATSVSAYWVELEKIAAALPISVSRPIRHIVQEVTHVAPTGELTQLGKVIKKPIEATAKVPKRPQSSRPLAEEPRRSAANKPRSRRASEAAGKRSAPLAAQPEAPRPGLGEHFRERVRQVQQEIHVRNAKRLIDPNTGKPFDPRKLSREAAIEGVIKLDAARRLPTPMWAKTVKASMRPSIVKLARESETHKSIMGKLEPGDIIHVGMAPRIHKRLSVKGLGESVFRSASKSVQGSMTHSAIYVGDGNIVESRIGEGVQEKSFKKALRGKSYIVLRANANKRRRKKAARFAKQQVGKDYDSTALVMTGAKIALPNWFSSAVDSGVAPIPKKAKVYTCSNLVTAAYVKAGVWSLGNTRTSPLDLRVSNKTSTVGKHFRKGDKERYPWLNPKAAWKIRKMQRQERGLSKRAVAAYWEELEKIASLSESIGAIEWGKVPDQLSPDLQTARKSARRRFAKIHTALKTQGVDVVDPSDITRTAVPKSKLTENDLKLLGFEPVVIAIPEKGQKRFRSYRHPASNHHVHDHGGEWVIHEDAHASTTMLWRKSDLQREGKSVQAPHKLKKFKSTGEKPLSKAKATVQGMRHLITEGVPGLAGYVKGQITGAPDMAVRMKEALPKSVRRRFKKWVPSKTVAPDWVPPKVDAPQLPKTASLSIPSVESFWTELEKVGAATQKENLRHQTAGFLGGGAAAGGLVLGGRKVNNKANEAFHRVHRETALRSIDTPGYSKPFKDAERDLLKRIQAGGSSPIIFEPEVMSAEGVPTADRWNRGIRNRESAQKLMKQYKVSTFEGLPQKVQASVTDAINSQGFITTDKKTGRTIIGAGLSPTTLLHELGHAQKPKGILGKSMKVLGEVGRGWAAPVLPPLFRGKVMKSPSFATGISLLNAANIGHSTTIKDPKTKRESQIGAGTLATLSAAPAVGQLSEEARASLKARKAMRRVGNKAATKQLVRELIPAWGTYAGSHLPALAIGGAGAALAVRNLLKRPKNKPSKAMKKTAAQKYALRSGVRHMEKGAAAGHWRKLKPGQTGHDQNEGKVKGRTWVDRKEFAPGIPAKRKTQKIKEVKKPTNWQLVVQKHPAERAGDHHDIRLVDPSTGHAHSWATRKDLPGPGEQNIRVFQQPTHTAEYAREFEGEIAEGYGKTRKGKKVRKAMDEKVEVLEASDDFIRFNIYKGKGPEEFILTRAKKKEEDGKRAPWHLINVTKTSKRTQHLPFSKPKYKEIPVEAIDMSDPEQTMAAKLDGGHVLYELKKGRRPRTYSYRKPKDRKSGIIEHSHKVTGLYGSEVPAEVNGKGTILRGELYARRKDGKGPVPAETVGGMINAGAWRSRELQAEHGTLRPAIFDVVKFRGKDMADASYDEKLEALRQVKKHMPEFELPDLAFTEPEKKELLKAIKEKEHPQTHEGVILWNRDKAKKPIKAKFKSDHDIFIRKITPAVSKDGKQKDEAGALWYSWTPDGPIVGRVGTGFSRSLRQDMWKRKDSYIGAVAKVTALAKYKSGALGKPAFQGWHIDKNPETFWSIDPVAK